MSYWRCFLVLTRFLWASGIPSLMSLSNLNEHTSYCISLWYLMCVSVLSLLLHLCSPCCPADPTASLSRSFLLLCPICSPYFLIARFLNETPIWGNSHTTAFVCYSAPSNYRRVGGNPGVFNHVTRWVTWVWKWRDTGPLKHLVLSGLSHLPDSLRLAEKTIRFHS